MASLLLAGCTPTGIAIGAGARVATAAAEERGLRGSAEDTWVTTEINRRWFEFDHRLPLQATVTVRDGVALLTGVVDTADLRLAAVRLAWSEEAIHRVINELRVAGQDSRTQGDTADAGRDLWIAKTLEARLLFDGEILSINYAVDVADRVVYLMGTAQSAAERDRVIAHARDIAHVRRVVSYVGIKGAPGD
ncbi:BON domain-containing protein [Roseospirillum parvum]|uniref:BON domain-containing protein n=1 Tax=Roseospirillum parvum TaxID=83401 RepID=UPI001FE0ACC0|nr:BON domain-containing protein [Roseospirillum parvum]